MVLFHAQFKGESALLEVGMMVKAVLGIFKLRIGFTMVFTALVGMVAAAGETPPLAHALLLAVAVLLSAGAAGAYNHYYDADIDARMQRTRGRPFATGVLRRHPGWLLFIAALALLPVFAVAHVINPYAAAFVFLGAFFYGVVYTAWLKRRTWLNIVIGGLAGSFAILAGAAVVDPMLGPVPLALAGVLFLWTPSHFWSLAIAMKTDYAAAGVPMLPVVAGEAVTARVIFLNTLALVAGSLAVALYGPGGIYLAAAAAGGGWFLWNCVALIRQPTPALAMANFRASLVQLVLMLAGITADAWV